MKNFPKGLGLSTLVLGGAMSAAAFAQTPAPSTTTPTGSEQKAAVATDPAAKSSSTMNAEDTSSYATGQPLQPPSKEGFWGHMNPLARKKWVARSVDPIRERTNELDQLESKNANDIKDVDKRAQAGIQNAMMAANTADQHAADAANRANAAQSTAQGASSRTDRLNGTVQNLDQYQQVVAATVKFPKGRTTLGPQGKSDLDDLAGKLTGEKGYIIEVQGYSRGGVQTSQAMADSVVRYLVTEHQVPIYRIYRSGLGKQTTAPADGQEAVVNGVRVTLLHNSLAAMNGSQPSSMTGQSTAQPVTNQ